jgi:hypothetical protein
MWDAAEYVQQHNFGSRGLDLASGRLEMSLTSFAAKSGW